MPASAAPMRIVVFGANGRTGRELVGQALAVGHDVAAVTRHPGQMPPRERLAVVGADVTDAAAVDAAVAGGDAVVSLLGVPYSRKPVTVYSTGTANIIAAMEGNAVRGLVVAGTAAVDPGHRASDSVFFTRAMEPQFMRLPGRTVYADDRRMEALIRASGLDWTVIRACWLFNAPGVSDYRVCEGSIHGDVHRPGRPRGLHAGAADRGAVCQPDGRRDHDRGHARPRPADMARGNEEAEEDLTLTG